MRNTKFHDHALFIWKSFLKDRWLTYSWGAFAVLLTNLMQILAPKNIGWIVDFFAKKPVPEILTGKTDKETFLYLFIVLAASRILINIFRFMWRITLGRQTHYAAADLRRDVWEHVRFFKKEDLDRKFTKGVLMSASASDTLSARFIFGFTLVAVFDVAFLGLFTFITMANIHIPMALMSFVVLLFVPIFVRKLSKREVEQYRKIQDTLSHFNDLSSQAVSTIKLQRLTQTGPFWERRLMNVADTHRGQRLTGIGISLLYIPVMGVAAIISYVVLFVMGIYFTFNGKMSVGEFISMQGLMFLLHDPLMSLGFIISEWKKGFTALERLSEIYEHEKEQFLLRKGDPIVEKSEEAVLDVKNLSFTFKESLPLFQNLSFKLKKGERLGITGPIGSGKTTLVSILTGLERHNGGEVNFFGRPFSDYTHHDLRNYIGHVHQKAFLFADSIKVNVTMDREMNDEEVWKYLDLAGLKEDVEGFPNKLETQLGEWGINLSGGQKQRLTLARALARKPQLLFLDDCLSAVDTITEERILKNLDQHLKDVTLVWVAHRKSTLKYCNHTFELRTQN
ncbi:ABC transporter ATP-binding protein [Bacteriovorax sp. PP10]|uniref:ABC transporter ATP-binding protein n=1 Tax=Bacteriovorax antarcticus TaxID=3088717 RepID=A0ABU5VYM1_9BACT|nr:ABC transporter ATP-binding protein [Bacteriovorax sp. PP10]MEA9358146.1 ABC transporter ATP-binding protein [Bacteriovorax sp. PP10]